MKRFNISTLLGACVVALALSPIAAATAQAADAWDPQGYKDCKAEHSDSEDVESLTICCLTHGGKPVLGGLGCKDPAEDRAVAPAGPASPKNPTVPRAVSDAKQSGSGVV